MEAMLRYLAPLVCVVACADPSQGVAIDRVVPDRAEVGVEQSVSIEGAFHVLTSNLDEGGTTVALVTAAVDTAPLANTTWISEGQVTADVPGLAEGVYDVTVSIDGRSATLADAYIVGNPPSTVTCAATFIDVCAQSPTEGDIDIAGATTIDTDTDPRCTTVTQAVGSSICLIYASSITIQPTGTLTVTGSRPLAIAATSTMSIGGSIDVSSRRSDGQRGPASDDPACAFQRVPEQDLGGAGGGAGATFGGVGGNGGTGDTNSSIGADGDAPPGLAAPMAALDGLHGGCRGQQGANESATGGVGGPGGHGGGALYIYAPQRIDLSGAIRATGAGGEGGEVQAGGGGGGAGGLVVLESVEIAVSGQISANGGGGGEGGVRVGSTPVHGVPGTDGDFGTAPAPGGVSSDPLNGFGGPGGAGTSPAVVGTSSDAGGGGGGGAVGMIRLLGSTIMLSGIVSPPPS
jgi:hypothetical protein